MASPRFTLPADVREDILAKLVETFKPILFTPGFEEDMILEGVTFKGLRHETHEQLIEFLEKTKGDPELLAHVHRLQAWAEVAAGLATLRTTTNVEAIAYWRVVVRTLAPADPLVMAWFYELCGYTHDLKAQ